VASQNIRKSNSYEEEGRKLIHQFSQKFMSEQCNANEVDKKLSTLSFRDKGIGVWQHQALAENGQPGVAQSAFHFSGDPGDDHISWRPAS